MLRSALFLTITAMLASQAHANDCPTAQTAKLGFILEQQGTTAEVRPAPNHFVHVVNSYPSGKKQHVVYYRGFFPISRFDDTARSINIPVSDLRTVFPLELKARRAITYALAQPDKVGALVSLELTVTGQEQFQLGSCSYNVLIVRNRYLNAEGKVTSEVTDLYSPDLGFVLAKRYEEGSGRQTTVKYQTIRSLGKTSPL
ncbi:hypothetical protein FHR70_004591 [Microvirga lupini]|uniref:DUF4833 domain-containing protein n=1 Tax=Microvirga lupini TaxID=420324 RepID=A0A7W4VRA9_9HYPH|nr:hypothetical protein [Microvirga lupini]MBB3021495.1 hypothetical protein [Microvirga lupini]